jgi:prepilin-type N-terminal cleavage/methylation domain-containing protein
LVGVSRGSLRCPVNVETNVKAEGGFSLPELLVVIAVVAILAGLLFPVLSSFKSKAKRAVCLNNLRQINCGLRLYADDSADATPREPSMRTNGTLNWGGYKKLIKSYVGTGGVSSPQDKLFACPADTFYFTVSNNSILVVNKSFHDQPRCDYSSYGFNGGNLLTNLSRFGIDCTKLGIAGRMLSSIKNPSRTALVFEVPAESPCSWHQPKLPLSQENAHFSDAMNMVSFVDGHVSYIKIYWSHTVTNGACLNAAEENPPPGYAYQWSGD